jgi:hypothetical protein
MTDQLRDTVIRTTIDSLTRGELPTPTTDLCDLTLPPINDRPFPHVIHNQLIAECVDRPRLKDSSDL